MRDNTHGDKDDDQVEPDRNISEITKSLQGPDLSDQEASHHEDHKTNHEAKLAPRQLIYALPVCQDQETDIQEELDTLKDVAADSGPIPEDAKSQVTIHFDRVPIRVEMDEETPNLQARAVWRCESECHLIRAAPVLTRTQDQRRRCTAQRQAHIPAESSPRAQSTDRGCQS